MSVEFCDCGLPFRYETDNVCTKCSKKIKENRINLVEAIPFGEEFKTDLCICNETISRNWRSRKIGDLVVCNFCQKYTERMDFENAEDGLVLFDELDLPYTLDPSKPQYKVVTQKDRFFSSKFNPALIERALNEYAQDGWVLKEAVTADFGSIGMSRNELILFMEKLPNVQINN